MLTTEERRQRLLDLIHRPVSGRLVQYVSEQARLVIPCHSAGSNGSNGVFGPTSMAREWTTPNLPTIGAFVQSLIKRSCVKPGTLLGTLVFLERLQRRLAHLARGMPCTCHRVFLATLIVASKSLHDTSPKNKHWARYAVHFSLSEINLMEQQLLSLMDYHLIISPEEIDLAFIQYEFYKSQHQRHQPLAAPAALAGPMAVPSLLATPQQQPATYASGGSPLTFVSSTTAPLPLPQAMHTTSNALLNVNLGTSDVAVDPLADDAESVHQLPFHQQQQRLYKTLPPPLMYPSLSNASNASIASSSSSSVSSLASLNAQFNPNARPSSSSSSRYSLKSALSSSSSSSLLASLSSASSASSLSLASTDAPTTHQPLTAAASVALTIHDPIDYTHQHVAGPLPPLPPAKQDHHHLLDHPILLHPPAHLRDSYRYDTMWAQNTANTQQQATKWPHFP
ncbi:hypothetical protein BC940DRAFT_331813 [Gongronella butleri]|nr:hypothetical protein BC940DRAFT_331813 [Gongronella butleri]